MRLSAYMTIATTALAACSSSKNQNGTLDTAGVKSPRTVAAAGCSSLPSASDLSKYLKSAPDSGEAGGKGGDRLHAGEGASGDGRGEYLDGAVQFIDDVQEFSVC